MSGIIKLLPDSVANQIAAGEVIQRPASAVKELIENAVDAGANEITLIIKDAGKTLIQVIDNGKGMNDTDARLCFERHATSKISDVNDLFKIRTMGFRGEALASIAAIAQVEMKTKKADENTGIYIIIEGSEVKNQEICQCEKGTSISVKNLFYNVPARRNFLKSNPVETAHIIDEFTRVAIAFPDIKFRFFNNGKELYFLEKSNLKQRLIGLFGNSYNQKLIPVDHNSENLTIYGFISKPEFSKKTRGEQFFFVNKRFIKSLYLNNAIEYGYENMIQNDSFPSYYIFIDIDPKNIDINIHPTKTEIKFLDGKIIHAFLRSSIKLALGKFHIVPSIDFEVENTFNYKPLPKDEPIKIPTIKVNPDYNPFETKKNYNSSNSFLTDKTNRQNWENLYPSKNILQQNNFEHSSNEEITNSSQKIISTSWEKNDSEETKKVFFQLSGNYIISQVKSGLMIVNQQLANERIFYEKFINNLANHKSYCQKLLFPTKIDLLPSDSELFMNIIDKLNSFGFDITEFGNNSYVINGLPASIEETDIKSLIEDIIEQYKNNPETEEKNIALNIAKSLSKKITCNKRKDLKPEEINNIIDELFACEIPYYSPNGKPTFIIISIEELEKKFR